MIASRLAGTPRHLLSWQPDFSSPSSQGALFAVRHPVKDAGRARKTANSDLRARRTDDHRWIEVEREATYGHN